MRRPFVATARAVWHKRDTPQGRFTAAFCVTSGSVVAWQTAHRRQLHSSNCPAAGPSSTVTASGNPVLAASPGISFTNLHTLLSSHAPAIPVSSEDVRVLSSPTEFYETLLELASKAERRVLLSSLYLGTGPHERALVDTLKQRMAQKPNLKIDVLVDFLRGTRQVGAAKESSVTALQPLLQAASSERATTPADRFTLSLLHVPPPTPPVISALRAWLERTFFTGNKTREAVGVHHMKFYVFDDHTIISGANLSDTYFTTRQDRYLLVRNEQLASFYDSLVGGLKQLPYCRAVTADGQVQPALHSPLDSQATKTIVLPLFQPSPPVSTKIQSPPMDTWMFPTVQMGSVGLVHDEHLTSVLFQLVGGSASHLPSASPPMTAVATLDIATGYMNLTDRYMGDLLQVDDSSRVRFIAAARDANGWWGATGGGRYVPELYAAATLSVTITALACDWSNRVRLYEWSRPGWSYHAKGMWLTPPHAGAPMLTVVGSPNYGARSVQRDTESSLILLTPHDSALAHQLAREHQALIKDTSLVNLKGDRDDPSWAGPVAAAVPPPLWLRALSKLLRPYM